jgi:glycosyltransferase involved in cell wall biosynthesis
MNLFLNCSNLRFGGGLTVGINILNYYCNNPNIRRIVLIAPSGCGYEKFSSYPKVKIIFFPKIFNAFILKILSNYIVLPLLSFFSNPDFVFSLGNVAFPTNKPQFLLVHMPYLVYPESIVWPRIKSNNKKYFLYAVAMVKFVKINLKFASYWGVQTETMKNRINRFYHIPLKDIFVIPNAVSFTSNVNLNPGIKKEKVKEIRLLFLSKYYPHKNFEILYELGREIMNSNLPITITITINESDSKESKEFVRHIKDLQLDSVIINSGNILLENIAEAYYQHDGLLLPTL